MTYVWFGLILILSVVLNNRILIGNINKWKKTTRIYKWIFKFFAFQYMWILHMDLNKYTFNDRQAWDLNNDFKKFGFFCM